MKRLILIKDKQTGAVIVKLIPGLTAAESYGRGISLLHYAHVDSMTLVTQAFAAGQKYEQNR